MKIHRTLAIPTLLGTFAAGACAGEEEPDVAPVVVATTEPATAPVIPPPPTPADTPAVPVRVIIGTPAAFIGQPVVGRARVAEVVSDRGFWLEQNGQRIFAIIAQSPQMEDAVDINAGQMVAVAGLVYDNVTADQIPGGLEADARQIVANEPAFLYVPAQNIAILASEASP